MTAAPLAGVRVIDFTRYLSGPTLTMLLADLGADVIKVETLPTGDPARLSGPFHGSESVYYMCSNRNKRSLAVNLRTEAGKEVCRRLIDGADVFAQNFRPSVADAMGFDRATLTERNPALIYCNISGFGMEPPGADFPGFDQTAQAMSGLMSVTGTEQTGPLRAGIAVGDSTTGVFAAVGVLAALFARERTGRGSRVDASLMESMLTLMSYQAQKYLSLEQVPGQDGNDHPLMFPQGTFAARDGVLTLASGNERMWTRLRDVLGLDALADDPRFADNAARMRHRVELRRLIEEALARDDVATWIERINAAGIPSSPVLDVAQALEHPFTAQLEMVAEVEHTSLGTIDVLGKAVKHDAADPDWLRHPPPLLGEHSIEICGEAGYDEEQIATLLADGTVVQWNAEDAEARGAPL